MKFNNKLIIALILITLVTALYRVFPNRPAGFAPQLAVALFSGFLFTQNKKWAFALPLLSMFLSDCVYQLLFVMGKTEYGGFYGWGQFINYGFVALMACFGFLIKENKWAIPVTAFSGVAASTAFYFISNSYVWATKGGFVRPQTFDGYMQCLTDGLPFYKTSLAATAIFSLVLFAGYYLIKKTSNNKQIA